LVVIGVKTTPVAARAGAAGNVLTSILSLLNGDGPMSFMALILN